MSELVYVTSNLNAIVDNLLEKTVINEWMKDYILVRNFTLFFSHTLPINDLKMFNLYLNCYRKMTENQTAKQNCMN